MSTSNQLTSGHSVDSDEEDDHIMLFQITDIDASNESLADKHSTDHDLNDNLRRNRSDSDGLVKPLVTLRERRLLKAYSNVPPLPGNIKSLGISKAQEVYNKEAGRPRKLKPPFERIMKKLRSRRDSWEQYHLDDLETELCYRHRYNPHRAEWTKDQVLIKMEKKPFTRGAMRQCYRVKKRHSTKCNSSHGLDVMATNYVAKSYIENVDRDVYFQDVKLQMDAKVWGEEYDRMNPPKKVDIFQMYILEFPDRPGSPLFHLEHFIEGEYIKYNSNSGFVEEHLRLTPQAFSHFTFERSGHQLIVVDIQGVGDLYTDPQIHTADGLEYGEGNLGPRGMALFFHSHICNSICEKMELTPFDLSTSEMRSCREFINKQKNVCFTELRRGERNRTKSLSESPCLHDPVDLTRILERHHSVESGQGDDSSVVDSTSEDDISSLDMSVDSPINHLRSRVRFNSESEHDSLTAEEERRAFANAQAGRHRASCVSQEIDYRLNCANIRIGDSVLGQIHHEMAKYHEMGRFSVVEDEVDWDAALYHEEHAAELGVLEAINTLAKLYLGLQRDLFLNCTVNSNSEMIDRGVDYMVMAAEAGDRNAMIFMARAFETGLNLGQKRSVSWEDAVYWYHQAIERTDHDEGGEFDSTMADPNHQLLSHKAAMYRTGGHGLSKDSQKAGDLYNEAAEAAMADMKGRLANKYFMEAEECYGEMEEDE